MMVVVGVGPSHNIFFAGFLSPFFPQKTQKKSCIFRVLKYLATLNPTEKKKERGVFGTH